MKVLIINLICFLILVVVPFFKDMRQKKKLNVKLQKIQNNLEYITLILLLVFLFLIIIKNV